ncbi:MAG TPA: hypothetical protein VLE73_01195 [Candidatus Saccharimonadales bacterium]|nr:hypothetical protein [Candidatus Saccharimonadales bacterium]
MRTTVQPITKRGGFLEGFTKGFRTVLFIIGYVLLGAAIVSLTTPQQDIFYAIVDGSVIRYLPALAIIMVTTGLVNGIAHLYVGASSATRNTHATS